MVIRRIEDYVEDDFLNICADDLLNECSNFVRTSISSISIRTSISNHIHMKWWNVTFITRPCHDSNGQAGARPWNGDSHQCLEFNGYVRAWVLVIYHMQCILRIMLEFSSVDVSVFRRFGFSTFRFVDVWANRRFGLSTFLSVDIFACRRFGLSTFQFADVLVCRRFGLSTFRFVDVSVCRRFGCRHFGLSTFWLVTDSSTIR